MRAVNSVVFAPGGETLASGSSDGTVRVWRASDGELLFTLEHPAGVNSVAFAPDGLLLASGAEDGIVRLWKAGDATVLQPVPLQFLTQSDMDALFGTGNWFCFPDGEKGVGVRILPGNFTVQPPLFYIDTWVGRYAVGQTSPGLTGATAELDGRLPRNECPSFQQEALVAWVAARAADTQPLSKVRLDDLFGGGNWECLPDHASGIQVKRLSSSLTVQYPCAVVDVRDAKYGVGDVAPGGERVTVWLANPVPQDECP